MSNDSCLIEYNQYIHNRNHKFMYVKDIKYTLKYYNLDPKGKKPELLQRLDEYYKKLNSYNKFNNEAITIQKYVKGYLVRKKLNNMDYYFRNRCTNKEDFYTFQSIDKIDPLYFFSYEDNGFNYFFDIRSFEKLLDNKHNNPYNREPIPKKSVEKFYNQLNNIKKSKYFKPFENEEDKLTEEQKYNNYVTKIFQKIDSTNSIAGGTNINWFQNLSIFQLINFYKVLEDIWIHRANLTKQQQDAIVPGRNIFRTSINMFICNKYSKHRLLTMKYMILGEMEKLVSSSPEECHRTTGAYYILIALVEASPQCSEAMPWLIQ